jgi:hypothetical protein
MGEELTCPHNNSANNISTGANRIQFQPQQSEYCTNQVQTKAEQPMRSFQRRNTELRLRDSVENNSLTESIESPHSQISKSAACFLIQLSFAYFATKLLMHSCLNNQNYIHKKTKYMEKKKKKITRSIDSVPRHFVKAIYRRHCPSDEVGIEDLGEEEVLDVDGVEDDVRRNRRLRLLDIHTKLVNNRQRANSSTTYKIHKQTNEQK